MRMSVELKGVKEALELYDPKKVRQATRSTLDKTMTFMKRRIVELISSAYYITPRDIRLLIEKVRTTMTSLESTIIIRSSKFSLIYYGAIQTAKGVMAKIHKGRIIFYEGAFIQTMRTGYRGVFIRKIRPWPKGITGDIERRKYLPGASALTRADKLRMKHLPGPSVTDIVGSEKWKEKIEKEAGDHMEKLLLEEIDKRIYKGFSKPQ